MLDTINLHGITSNTPTNILFGAGAYFKNLKWESDKWTGDCLGATSGGGKVSIVGELKDIELDGALVKVKGLTAKTGGKGTMDVNFAELTTDNLKMTTLFEEGTSEATGFTMLQDKVHITDGDYVENLAFVGETMGGKNIIVIFKNALCTSGAEFEPKNKENTVFKGTFEACADTEGATDRLPIRIYYPDLATV